MEANLELAEAVRRTYAVFNTGDASGIENLVSGEQGILGIGTDPREWWMDGAFIEAFHAQAPEMHKAGLKFNAGDIQALSEGSVGWIADQPTLTMPDGSAVQMRLTGAFRRESDQWKMVQFHLSIGATNDEALVEDLTI